jgi:hypothetical protein
MSMNKRKSKSPIGDLSQDTHMSLLATIKLNLITAKTIITRIQQERIILKRTKTICSGRYSFSVLSHSTSSSSQLTS